VDGVTIDLLCDRYPNEHRGEVNLPGARMVTVMQLPGPAAALQDARDEAVDPSLPGSPIVAVAGLGGYLLAKAGAAGSRGEPRDHYDFWWVTLHTDGGPAAAIEAIRQPRLEMHRRRQHQAVMALINDALISGKSATAYAETMLRLGSADSHDMLIQDVVTAAEMLKGGLMHL